MELEQLFTDQKWNILFHLSTGEFSPLQLAHKTNTTISNISQQLRLLEAAGLVKKKKISNRDKGKPRVLFTLTDDYAYLISITKNFASKRLLALTDYHKAILKIWSLADAKKHPVVAQAYATLLPSLAEFDCIYIAENSKGLEMKLVFNGSKAAPQLLKDLQKEKLFTENGLLFEAIDRQSFSELKRKDASEYLVLHDPEGMIQTGNRAFKNVRNEMNGEVESK